VQEVQEMKAPPWHPSAPKHRSQAQSTEALSKDVGRAIARMGPEDLDQLGSPLGTRSKSPGKRGTVRKAMPAHKGASGGNPHPDRRACARNAGVGLDDSCRCARPSCRPAERVVLASAGVRPPSAIWIISAACSTACRYWRETASRHAVRQPVGGFQSGEHHTERPGADQSHHPAGHRQPAQAEEGADRSTSYEISAGQAAAPAHPRK